MSSKSPDKANEEDTQKRGRGRPRNPDAAEAIREATTQLLSEEGYHGLTMSGVAKLAGVAKTTIYRRWPSKAEMVLDAITEDATTEQAQSRAPRKQSRAPRNTGDPIADLRDLVVQFYRRVSGRSDPDVPIAPAELLREAEVAEIFRAHFVDPMLERALALVERAVDAGRLRQGVDPATLVDTLTAPAIYRPVVLQDRAGADAAEHVFDLVMRGALSD